MVARATRACTVILIASDMEETRRRRRRRMTPVWFLYKY